ncbi:Stealth CR1 domain-containing protein [Tenacibaculum sp.]|uniref:Stealth CR1 domain-containing protein n=1 Tax=Tenacibaculum sp. TaxID=1906242 RepID=UPI003D0D86F4
MQIDAVITWVDSSDEVWRNKINQYLDKKIDWDNKRESTRYNSINEIEITILSILKFAVYIKNIYVVTDNQRPHNFLKLKEKALSKGVNLELVDHTVIFRGYEEYLPTFNSQSIETMIYRIPKLSEHFVYFNDDVFLIKETKPEDFFQHGYPVLRGKWKKLKENIWYKKLGKKIKKKNKVSHLEAIDKSAKLIGFSKRYTFHHTPHPLRKSTFESFFKENIDLEVLNVKFKFRDANQYVPQGLINHLEIKNKTCVMESNLSLCYIQSYSFFKVRKKIIKANIKKKKVLFMCLQSLETAPQKTLKYILNWVDDRLDSNFANDL